MMNVILNLLGKAEIVMLVEDRVGYTAKVETSPADGTPDNQVVRLAWTDSDNRLCSTILTENGLNNATVTQTGYFEVEDFEGTPLLLKMIAKGLMLKPEDADTPVYVLIQEGGSSQELYIHAHSTREEAEEDRRSCCEDGSYRTSDILEVPASLANHPKFYEFAEQLARATLTLDYPSEA